MLDDGADALKAKPAIKRLAWQRGVQHHARRTDAFECAEHQRASDPGALQRRIDDHQADPGHLVVVGPPHRRADELSAGRGGKAMADCVRELPVLEPVRPSDCARQDLCFGQVVCGQGSNVERGGGLEGSHCCCPGEVAAV